MPGSGAPDAEIRVIGNAGAQSDAVSLVNLNSRYHIRETHFGTAKDASKADPNTVYVESFRTTLLGNKARGDQETTQILELREIDEIVYVGGGQETVLWSR